MLMKTERSSLTEFQRVKDSPESKHHKAKSGCKICPLQLTSVEVCGFVPAEDPALSLNIDSVFGLLD